MQYLLNAPGLSLAVDAAFGSLTAVAVRVFQSINGLKVDRIIGNATWPVLIVKVSSGSSGDAGAPFYSAQARIHACVIFFSGHVVSLAINRRLQVADAVAWSSAFVGQRKFNDRHDLDEGPASSTVSPGMTISRVEKVRLKALFTHLVQKQFASSIKPRLDRLGRDTEKFLNFTLLPFFQSRQDEHVFQVFGQFVDCVFQSG